MKIVQDQVPKPFQKAMNHAHAVFAPSLADAAGSMETLGCWWKHLLLDFSGVKDVVELLSKLLFADTEDKEVLHHDVIEVPVLVDAKGAIVLSEFLLGFKVGCVDGEGGHKVAPQQPNKKSVLADKLAKHKSRSSSSIAPNARMSSGQWQWVP
jgi:hypothetical protein